MQVFTYAEARQNLSILLIPEVSRFLKIPKLQWCTTAAGMNLFFAVFAMHVAKPHFIIP
jgi:hypothetical protein